MLLTSILGVPFVVGLLCLFARPRRLLEFLNIAGFASVLVLGVKLFQTVLANPGNVASEWNEFLRADALSAWMVLLISVVSLATALYAGRYFRRDLAAGVLTAGRVREFYVLTPLFAAGMLLVVLANNLGVMWFAVEATALSSVLLVALYNRRTSLEAAWKYIILGSLGLALALLGTVFLYAAAVGPHASETLPSFNWSHLMTVAPQLDPRPDQAGLRVRAGRLRHQGRARPHAHLAARRAQRGARRPPARCSRACRSRSRFTPCCGSTSSPRPAWTPTSAAIFCWAWACSPCSWPRRSFWCRTTSNGCSPIRASNTSASSAPASP